MCVCGGGAGGGVGGGGGVGRSIEDNSKVVFLISQLKHTL